MTAPPNRPAQAEMIGDGLCTHILVTLKVRDDVDFEKARGLMRDEMIATSHLYLNGKIEQWFSQLDERGVVFLFNTTNIEETRSLMADLPLVKAKLVDLHFTRLGPLLPMRALLGTINA